MRISIAIALALLCIGCKPEGPKEVTTDMLFFDEKDKDNAPKLEIVNGNLDFGKVIDGDHVEHTFVLKNVGNAPLVVSEVAPSCGCTTPKSWSREPVEPGKTTELVIDFDSKDRLGKIDKSISVYHNGTPSVNVIKLSGEVVAIKK